MNAVWPTGCGPPDWTFQDKKCGPEVVSRLAFIQVLDQENGGRFERASGHIQVSWGRNGRLMKIINIGTVVQQAQMIHYRDTQWLVKYRIDLQTFNDLD